MKPLTPKQRRRIYLEAAKHFSSPEKASEYTFMGFCGYLSIILKDEYEFPIFIEYVFISNSPHRGAAYWYDEFNQSHRVTALLFAAEMTKDAKK